MEYVYFILGAFVALLLTLVVSTILTGTGTLRIDHSNPDKDAYLFEIADLDKLDKKKYFWLRIEHESKHSQK
jgi:hypothetical protein